MFILIGFIKCTQEIVVKLEEALSKKTELMYFYWAHEKYINISRLRQTLEKKMKNKVLLYFNLLEFSKAQ